MGKETSIEQASPRMVELNTSNQCNLRCLTCVRSWEEFRKPEQPIFLTLGQFKIILSRFPGLEELQICGFSEPTLNRDVPDMIRHAKAEGVPHVEMFTNATVLRGDVALPFADSGLDLLRASIDGGDPETYRQVRGADLNTVTENVRAFAEMSGIPVRMESVLSKHTVKSAGSLPDVAAAADAKFLAIRLLDGQDSNVSANAVYEPIYLAELKRQLTESCQEKGIELIMDLPGEEGFPSRCTAWKEVYVNEQGRLVPCYLLRDNVAGNLLEVTFEQIRLQQGPVLEAERGQNGGFLEGCCCNLALLTQGKTAYPPPVTSLTPSLTRL